MLIRYSYRHAVTGVVSHIAHPEAGGGVLADDMGMGKSLSILSLVARTSDQADEWLHVSQDALNDGFGSSKTRSKATLIIVSSACKFGPASTAERMRLY
jgi:SWI/SNF-related matrix-associated actin-dependent regulator of chromatin subfamily A3